MFKEIRNITEKNTEIIENKNKNKNINENIIKIINNYIVSKDLNLFLQNNKVKKLHLKDNNIILNLHNGRNLKIDLEKSEIKFI